MNQDPDNAYILAQQRNIAAMTPEQMKARELQMAIGMQNAAQSYPGGDALRNMWPADERPQEPEPPRSLLSRLAAWWRA